MVLYSDGDAHVSCLRGRVIAVIGYGNQGSAQARCLRDSGLNVVVGVRKGASWKRAEEDRMPVLGIAEAVKKADVVLLLVPDMAQPEVYERYVKPGLSSGKTLCFAHGFNIAYGLIKPPKNIDVVLLAPKATGSRLREAFLNDEGVPGLIAIHQDASGNAKASVLGLAKALRITKKGVFECSFGQETFANLFAEQCVTVGGQLALLKAGFDVMVKNGIPPEVAYFECIGVTKLIVDMLEREGLRNTVYGVSETAGYGGLSRGKRVVDERSRKAMQEIFDEVSSGAFAKEWVKEHSSGMRKFEEMKLKESGHPLERVGKKLRMGRG